MSEIMENTRTLNMSDEDEEKKINRRLRIMFLVCFFMALIVIWIFLNKLFPGLLKILVDGDEKKMTAYIKEQGMWKGFLCVFLMNILQVISIFLPGNVIQVTSGIIYTWWQAFIVCYIGFMVGNIIVFIAANHLAENFTGRLLGKEKYSYLKKRIESGNPMIVAALANLIPGFPNGMVPYLAAYIKLPFKKFVIAVGLSCWVQIVLYCIAGHFFIRGRYLYSVAAVAVEILVTVIVYLRRDRLTGIFDK